MQYESWHVQETGHLHGLRMLSQNGVRGLQSNSLFLVRELLSITQMNLFTRIQLYNTSRFLNPVER